MNYTEPKVIYTCFPGGKHKVLTMSYDDGRLEDRRLVELFNRYGIRGTFNLNGGLPRPERIPESEWVELYKGHEVACHTYHHPTISRSPLDQTARQVLADRMQLEGVMGYPVRGLAYPNGSWTPEIAALLPALGIRYARVVGDTHDFAMPHDFMTWKATCHHTHNLLEDGKRFVELYKTQYLYMMYVWGHSFEFRTEEDWALMAEKGVSCIHNPVSNLKLGSGVAWIPAMKRAGVNIALGTDGVSSNNNHDMFEEMKFAAILHNGVTHDPLALLPRQVLAMATRDGARALGRRTGQIAPGYTADLILVDFDRPSLTPCHSVEDNLVYSARGSDVVVNMARGKIIYKDGTFFTLDLERIKAEVETYALPLLFGDGASLADRRN